MVGQINRMDFSFHSIGFPSEWGGGNVVVIGGHFTLGFHSIGFPSEWGVPPGRNAPPISTDYVSIQLVSPASGELNSALTFSSSALISFPFNWFPQRVGSG